MHSLYSVYKSLIPRLYHNVRVILSVGEPPIPLNLVGINITLIAYV